MPKRKYKWWSRVTAAMSEPNNEYVNRALNIAEKKITKWDYDLLIDCIQRRYRKRECTLFQVAVDHNTTENVAWYTVKCFIFMVAKEMGFVGNHSQ